MRIYKSFFLLCILILCSLFIAACGSDENADAGSTKETVYKLKSSIQSPKEANLSKGFDAYLDEIEKKSDGRIEFERYYSESLVKAADTANAIGSGIGDVALLVPGYTPANNPLGTVESMPALWKDQWTGTRAMLDLYNEFPELKEEYHNQGIEVVGAWALPSYYVISTKDVSSFDDIKGQKVVAAGSQSILAEALGATPVGIVITESFEAMERGAVEGALLGLTSSSTYGIQEVAESVWQLPIGSQAGIIGINKAKFDEFPEDLQNVFNEVALQNAVDFHEVYQIEGEEAAMQKYIDAGVKMNEATEEDIAELQEIARNSVWKTWVNNADKDSELAQKVLDRFIELIAEYDGEFQEQGLPE